MTLDNDLVCDNCFNKYPIKIDFMMFPIKKYSIKIFSLFPKYYKIPENAFIKEYSRLFNFILEKNNNKSYILSYDTLFLTASFFNKMEILSTLIDDDIYVLCNFLVE